MIQIVSEAGKKFLDLLHTFIRFPFLLLYLMLPEQIGIVHFSTLVAWQSLKPLPTLIENTARVHLVFTIIILPRFAVYLVCNSASEHFRPQTVRGLRLLLFSAANSHHSNCRPSPWQRIRVNQCKSRILLSGTSTRRTATFVDLFLTPAFYRMGFPVHR